MFYFEQSYDLSGKKLFEEQLDELTDDAKKYVVILHNDSLNGVDFVTKAIKDVFGYSTRKALWLMLKAHFTGKSHLWIGEQKKALKKRHQMVLYGADPNMIEKGAMPLQVTIEPYDK